MYSGNLEKNGNKVFFFGMRWCDEFRCFDDGNDIEKENEWDASRLAGTVGKVWKAIRCCCCFLALQNPIHCNCDDDAISDGYEESEEFFSILFCPIHFQILGLCITATEMWTRIRSHSIELRFFSHAIFFSSFRIPEKKSAFKICVFFPICCVCVVAIRSLKCEFFPFTFNCKHTNIFSLEHFSIVVVVFHLVSDRPVRVGKRCTRGRWWFSYFVFFFIFRCMNSKQHFYIDAVEGERHRKKRNQEKVAATTEYLKKKNEFVLCVRCT